MYKLLESQKWLSDCKMNKLYSNNKILCYCDRDDVKYLLVAVVTETTDNKIPSLEEQCDKDFTIDTYWTICIEL